VLVVFPQVLIIDEGKDTVFPGVVLQRSQTVAADQEMERVKSSSPLVEVTPPTRPIRPRRMTSHRCGSYGHVSRGCGSQA
jgi:hypothetical protein